MTDELRSIFLSVPAMLVLGLVVGSFLNVVIHRLPLMIERQWLSEAAATLAEPDAWRRIGASSEADDLRLAGCAEHAVARLSSLPRLDLNNPDSHCPRCQHGIRWFENIPVLSWLYLRGRCSNCGASISPRYFVMELTTGLLFAVVSWRLGPTFAALAWAGFMAAVMAASVIDLETTLLPDAITLPLAWAGLLAAVAGFTVAPSMAVLGAAAGYALPWAIAWVYERLAGPMVMAPGDFKLLAAIGAWMGWQLVLPVLLLGFIGGGLALVLHARRAGWRERYFPFGPYLGGVAITFALIGPKAIAAWL